MPNSCGALTTTKPGSGEPCPAFTHPCARTHFATNLRARATLHDYHLHGDEVNADSNQTRNGVEAWLRSFARSFGANCERSTLRHAQSCHRCAHQLLDTCVTFCVLDLKGRRGVITVQGLALPAELGEEVAAGQLKERV